MSFLPPCSSQLKSCLKALVALSQAVVLCKLRGQSSALSVQEDGGCQENKQGFFARFFLGEEVVVLTHGGCLELHVKELVMNSFFSHLRFIYFSLLGHLLFPLLFHWARGEHPSALGSGELLLLPTHPVPPGQGGFSMPRAAFLLSCSLWRCRKCGVLCSGHWRGSTHSWFPSSRG